MDKIVWLLKGRSMPRGILLAAVVATTVAGIFGSHAPAQVVPAAGAAADSLEAGFHRPPEAAKPLTLWTWINGNVTREGITADLESFKRVGLAGTQQFLIGGHDSGTEHTLDNPKLVFLSDEWRALEKFAVQESARLGLDFGTHNCAGWSSSGGPWITPEQSMKKIISAENAFTGPGKFQGPLATGPVQEGFYRDIAVVAFRVTPLEGPPPASPPLAPGLTGNGAVAVGRMTAAVPRESIVDLTDKFKDGVLTWDAPAGEWTIVRFGYTSTGKKNVASPEPASGLECDKLDRAALEAHYAAYPAKLLADAGSLAGTTFKRFEIDSYEAGPQDWTGAMREEFKKRRGYDPVPLLPALTPGGNGRRKIVDAAGNNLTVRFINDLNVTVAELFLENYFGYLQELIHKTPGLQLAFEPYNTSAVCPFDTNNLCAVGDVLMTEFWQRPSEWGWTAVRPVTSGAHAWGKRIVAAEAFTGQPDHAFQSDPYSLKATGDRAYAMGVNKFMYHTAAHQPWMNVAPGMTMGQFGTHFGRTITWWEHGAKEWIAYQARCQFLLQQGTYVGDVAYLKYGRQAPPRGVLPGYEMPPGFSGDFLGTDSVLHHLAVRDGALVLPSGMSYKLLVLPETPTMTPQLLRKLKELVNAGGIILGPKPTASPSLENYPACDEEVKQLAAELWGNADGKAVREHAYGKGKVFWGVPPEEVLASLKVAPDLELKSTAKRGPLWIHRKIGDAELYFISNQADTPEEVQANFRVAGKVPEFWRAESATIEQVPVWEARGGRTRIPLALPPSGSVFVVFRKPAAGVDPIVSVTRPGTDGTNPLYADLQINDGRETLKAKTAGDYRLTTASGKSLELTVKALPAPVDLSAEWTVAFPPKLGAPASITLPRLMNLSEHETPGVKYFSGTMTYTREVDLPEALFTPPADRVLTLDLGTVKNVAEVRINGKELPLMWLPPFAADVTSLVKPGKNTLEVKITNLWVNRLIGDEQLPDDLEWGELRKLQNVPSGQPLLKVPDWIDDPGRRPSKERVTFVTFKHFRKDSPLPVSGLVGPVTLQAAERVEIKR
jgi:hypothetical protein